jgi:hypothetical protein
MAAPNILGDITSAMIGNYISTVAGTGADSAASQRMLGRMVEKGGDELKGVSDPLEKIFNRLTYHIEEHGMTADMQRQYESLGRHLSTTPDAPKILSNAHAAYSMGETLRTTPAVISKPASSLDTSTKAADDVVKPNLVYSINPESNPDLIIGGAPHRIQAMHPVTGEEMGRMTWWGIDDPAVPAEIDKIEVGEKFRRQGIATSMLNEGKRLAAEDSSIPSPIHSKTRTADGDAWAKSTGDYLPEKNVPAPTPTPESTLTTSQKWEAARIHKDTVDPAAGWKAMQEAALESTDLTRKSIEENGYLYHYAPREHRESILSEGLMTSKARTAAMDATLADKGNIPSGGIYFFTDPNDAPSANWVVENRPFAPGSSTERVGPGADLYRVKIEPGMLDDVVVDAKLPIRDDAASAVIATNKFGAFKAELIGENASFGMRDVNYTPVTPTAVPTSGDVLSEPPPPKPTRTGPGDIGKPADVRTRPSSRGADAASTTTGSTPKPPPTTGSVAMDPPKVPTTPPSSGAPSKMRGLMDDGLEAAKNVAARNPMGIRAAAVAGLLGVGAVVAGRRGQPRSDQRNTYLEESRRKMQG